QSNRYGECLDGAAARLRSLWGKPCDRKLRHHRPRHALHSRRRHDFQSADAHRARCQRADQRRRTAGTAGAACGIRRGSGGSDSEGARGVVKLNSIAEALARAKAPCITSSFQAECVVLTHMLLESAPHIPVLFLDTVHHFAETYAYRDAIAERWKLNL